MQVTYHKDNGDPVSEHVVRLKREANVADLIAEVASQVRAEVIVGRATAGQAKSLES
jgi:hypothetical protein